MYYRFFRWNIAAFLVCYLTLAGCGGVRQERFGPAPPPSFGLERFRPNYGGDLTATNYWSNLEISYRIVSPGKATDIRLNPIGGIAPTPVQVQDIRDGWSKWGAALAKNDPPGRRTFREVSGDDPTAQVDIVVQSADDFGATSSINYEQFGQTDYYLPDVTRPGIARAVIRIRADLPERNFRFTILHEQGHGLGMLGHSRKVGTVMRAIEPLVIPPVELTEYDDNTVGALYSR